MLDGILFYHIFKACLMVTMMRNVGKMSDTNHSVSLLRITYILKKLLNDRPFGHFFFLISYNLICLMLLKLQCFMYQIVFYIGMAKSSSLTEGFLHS